MEFHNFILLTSMIFSKKIYTSGSSLSRLAWSRFKKNISGMISLFVIIATVIIAILGYLITPDSSPMCNTQILEICTQKPGFSTEFLKIRKNQPLVIKSALSKMIMGEPSNYNYIPITSYKFNKKNIDVTIFDPDNNNFKESYNIENVLFDISNSVGVDNTIVDNQSLSYSDMEHQIVSENIEKQFFLLGTDQFGRDLLSRLIIGTRVSLSVGAISVAISLLVGILLGSIAGFYRGTADDIIMWFINVVWSIPTLLLVIAITFAIGRGFWQIFIAVGLTMWVEVARVVRGQILGMREKEYVEAGFALGFSNLRIIAKHIIPNILSPVIVISAANFAAAILIEAGLSFLGIGVQPPMPSWGSMIKEYYSFIILDSAYLAIVPGIAIIILVLAFMTLGNALRDTLDVKMQKD